MLHSTRQSSSKRRASLRRPSNTSANRSGVHEGVTTPDKEMMAAFQQDETVPDSGTILRMQSMIGNQATMQLLHQNRNAGVIPQAKTSSKLLQRINLAELQNRKLRTTDATPDYALVAEKVNGMIATATGPKYLKTLTITEEFLRAKWDILLAGAGGTQSFRDTDKNDRYADTIFKALKKPEKAASMGFVGIETGGREFSLENSEISDYMAGLAEHIANYMNTKLEKAPIRIAGSVGIMKADPDSFTADDIDIDYYDKKASEPEAAARWQKALEAFGQIPDYVSELGKVVSEGVSVEGTKSELAKATWTLDTGDTIRYVEVEMKNVSGVEWHAGMKDGRRRAVGEGPWLPETQLYMDVVSRVVDLIFAAQENDEIEDKPKAVQEAADAKSIFTKKRILKTQLKREGMLQAHELAEDKLTTERYEVWNKVSNGIKLSGIFAEL